MRIASDTHLTYCTNIHAGESWAEVRRNLETHVAAVKAAVAPDRPFGVGLRLSSEAARALEDPADLESLREILAARGLYVFTLNGFPYGTFHRARVKGSVYEPDWSREARADYTTRLAVLLAKLLPDGVAGSVSTVPIGFRPAFREAGRVELAVRRLVDQAAALVRLEAETGKLVRLCLEPEPECVLETVAETIRFFEEHLFAGSGNGEAALRRHLGVCLDTCHAAVEFEEPASAVRDLRAAGITIAKVQLSAGLQARAMGDREREELARFADDVYLHQVVEKRADGKFARHLDLPDALAAPQSAGGGEWRIHFHVPLFLERLGLFGNTQAFLREILAMHRAKPISTHLEVETYTWDVLPPEHRTADVSVAVARELRWVLDRLAGS